MLKIKFNKNEFTIIFFEEIRRKINAENISRLSPPSFSPLFFLFRPFFSFPLAPPFVSVQRLSFLLLFFCFILFWFSASFFSLSAPPFFLSAPPIFLFFSSRVALFFSPKTFFSPKLCWAQSLKRFASKALTCCSF